MHQMFGDGALSKILHLRRSFAQSFGCSTFEQRKSSRRLLDNFISVNCTGYLWPPIPKLLNKRCDYAAAAGGGIGGGIVTEIRFRQATR
jgi:hypothetical protein